MHSLVALLFVIERVRFKACIYFLYTEAGEVPPPPPVDERELTPYSAVVRWNPPADSNGVILQYTVNYVAVSNTLSQDTGRHRRQTSGASVECILGGEANVNRNMTVNGTQTSATLTELSEYTLLYVSNIYLTVILIHIHLAPGTVYKFRVQAETAVGGGPFSNSRNFTTSENGICLLFPTKCTTGYVLLIHAYTISSPNGAL